MWCAPTDATLLASLLASTQTTLLMGKKGGKKGGGKKAPPKPLTMATGGNLQTVSSFALWKLQPPVSPLPKHVRSAPALPSSYVPVEAWLPIAIVRAVSAGNKEGVLAWIAAGGPPRPGATDRINLRWNSPTGTMRRFTLLMLSTLADHVPLVEALLRRGADVDAVNAKGQTALILAAASGRHLIVQKLLRAGCRTDLTAKLADEPNAKLGNSLDFAVMRRQSFVAALLDTHEACSAGKPPSVIHPEVVAACAHGNTERVVVWLECGGTIEATHTRPDGPQTLLMLACEAGHSELVRKLIQLDASTDVKRSSDGATPMMIAAYMGHREVVRILLQPRMPKPHPGYIFAPAHRAPPTASNLTKSNSTITFATTQQGPGELPISPTKSEP